MVPSWLLLLAALVVRAVAASVDQYAVQCHSVFAKIVANSQTEIDALRERCESGELCPNLGSKADSICNQALETFSTEAPDAQDDPSKEAVFDEKVEELERTLDLPLQLVFMKQLGLLREKALQRFKTAARTSERTDYEASVEADQWFSKEAEASIRQGSTWDYETEKRHLRSAMTELAQRAKKTVDAQLKAAQQQATAMQYLQQQQQTLQALQSQLYGGNSPWNFGCAYRIPDTNINLQGSYQQGKANLQLSCVPDEYAPMLGPNGFTHGVGPGNLGLTVNLSI